MQREAWFEGRISSDGPRLSRSQAFSAVRGILVQEGPAPTVGEVHHETESLPNRETHPGFGGQANHAACSALNDFLRNRIIAMPSWRWRLKAGV